MPTTEEQVRILIDAEDQASAQVDKITLDLEAMGQQAEAARAAMEGWSLPPITGLEDQVARLDELSENAKGLQDDFAALGSDLDMELARSTESAGDGLETLISGFGQLKTAVMGAATLWGAQRSIEAVLQFGEAGAELINIENGFNAAAEAAGYSGDAMLAQLMAVGQGIVDDDFLMREFTLTTRMAGSEIADSWSGLIQVAMASAAQGVGDVQSNLQSLDMYVRTGFGRALRQMGLQLPDNGPIMEAYAASIGKATDELTEAEQAQARLNAVLQTAERQFGDLDEAANELAGGGITRLRNALGNLIENYQQLAAPPIEKAATGIAEVIEGVTLGTTERQEQIIRWLEQGGKIVSGSLDPLEEAAARYELLWARIQNQFLVTGDTTNFNMTVEQLVRDLNVGSMSAETFANVLHHMQSVNAQAAAEMQRQREAILHTRNEQEAMIATSQRLGYALGNMGKASVDAAADMDRLGKAIGNAWSMAADATGAMQGLWRAMHPEAMPQRSEYESGLAGSIEHMTDIYEWWQDKDAEAHDQMDRAMTQSAGVAGGAWNDMQSQMESYYESWQSQTEGILVPTQEFDLAALTEEVSGYQEQWDEAARRAMAVVKGGPANEWAAPMGLESKEEALQYVRDFYAGKLPEDVNWDAAIAQYQQQMEQAVGQQNLSAIFEQKLTEAGLGPDSELVAQALGAPFAAAGSDSATQFAQSFADYDWSTAADQPGKDFTAGFLGAASTALSKPEATADFRNNMRSFIIGVVQDYFFGGSQP